MKKVCIFFTEGFEEIEALTVVDLLRRASIDASMVSVTGKLQVNGARGIKIEADALFEDVDYDEVQMIVLPGGSPGWKNLEKCEKLMKLVDDFASKGRRISAICGAPSVLGRRGILKGRTACVYPEMDESLEGAVVTHKEVAVDRNIITSRGVGTAIPFSLAIIEELTDAATAQKISDSIVYRLEQ